MSIQKQCADHMRASYAAATGNKLSSGHAHELTAAYFGYKTAAALRSASIFPLTDLGQAAILVPDIALMEARRGQLVGLPPDLAPTREIAKMLSDLLKAAGYFSGQVWDSEYLSDDINGYVQDDPMLIEDDLSGAMAETNAYFDELYLDEVTVDFDDTAMVATITGSLNGEQDEDRAFHGDKIAFTSTMTMDRVSGWNAYARPEFETSGDVDDADYYDAE